MNIGKIKINLDGSVLFNNRHIGSVSALSLHQRPGVRHGNVGIQPSVKDISFTEVATELAAHSLSVTFDFYGEFWSNSFIRDGQWFAEIPDGNKTVVVPLNISAPIPEEPEYDAVVDSY